MNTGTLLMVSAMLIAGCRPAPMVMQPADTSLDVGAMDTSSGLGPTDTSTGDAPTPAVVELRYLSLGDSFTAGTGSTPMDAFPVRFAARFQAMGRAVSLQNPAVNGYSTADVIATELPELPRFHPSMVTLAIGANNIVRGGTAETYRADLRTILRACLDAGVTPTNIIALPQPEWPRSPSGQRFGGAATLLKVREFNDILRDEVRSVGGRWLDLTALMTQQADASAWASDGLHPNAASYDAWAERLAHFVTIL